MSVPRPTPLSVAASTLSLVVAPNQSEKAFMKPKSYPKFVDVPSDPNISLNDTLDSIVTIEVSKGNTNGHQPDRASVQSKINFGSRVQSKINFGSSAPSKINFGLSVPDNKSATIDRSSIAGAATRPSSMPAYGTDRVPLPETPVTDVEQHMDAKLSELKRKLKRYVTFMMC